MNLGQSPSGVQRTPSSLDAHWTPPRCKCFCPTGSHVRRPTAKAQDHRAPLRTRRSPRSTRSRFRGPTAGSQDGRGGPRSRDPAIGAEAVSGRPSAWDPRSGPAQQAAAIDTNSDAHLLTGVFAFHLADPWTDRNDLQYSFDKTFANTMRGHGVGGIRKYQLGHFVRFAGRIFR